MSDVCFGPVVMIVTLGQCPVIRPSRLLTVGAIWLEIPDMPGTLVMEPSPLGAEAIP